MNWNNCTWEEEDRLYSPKRKVDNKISWKRPHMIGSFYSNKMNKIIEYQSLNECLFYFLLELDLKTIRYYIQPVNIPIPYVDDNGLKKSWRHVPDVLVFRVVEIPYLYQIKENNSELSEKDKIINKFASKYALEKGWQYKNVYPKSIPEVILENIRFLIGFTKKRKWYDEWITEILNKVRYHDSIQIKELAYSFIGKVSPLMIIPVIYYLITKGTFYTELCNKVDENSLIQLNRETDSLYEFFEGEDILSEIK